MLHWGRNGFPPCSDWGFPSLCSGAWPGPGCSAVSVTPMAGAGRWRPWSSCFLGGRGSAWAVLGVTGVRLRGWAGLDRGDWYWMRPPQLPASPLVVGSYKRSWESWHNGPQPLPSAPRPQGPAAADPSPRLVIVPPGWLPPTLAVRGSPDAWGQQARACQGAGKSSRKTEVTEKLYTQEPSGWAPSCSCSPGPPGPPTDPQLRARPAEPTPPAAPRDPTASEAASIPVPSQHDDGTAPAPSRQRLPPPSASVPDMPRGRAPAADVGEDSWDTTQQP